MPLKSKTSDQIHELFELLEIQGRQQNYGELLSITKHSLEAAFLAEQESLERPLVVACLFHDIGWLLATGASLEIDHDTLGANWLAKFFPKSIYQPVALHVQAKRYLVAKRSGYFESLTKASQASLNYQGGPMTPAQARLFEDEEFFTEAISLRLIDDKAKDPEMRVPELASWLPLVEAYRL